MKKYLLSLMAFTAIMGFSQDIAISYEGTVMESPSDELVGESDNIFIFKYYYIHNLTGSELSLDWERERLADVGCFDEQVCTDENCYVPDDVALFASPEPATIDVGDSLLFKIGTKSDEDCCGIYRYRLMTGTFGSLQDSIDLTIKLGDVECFLSLEEDVKKEEISVYPNPANTSFFIANVANTSTAILYNLLGDVVVNTTLQEGVNEVSVDALPNGVYFYKIQNEQGEIVETKKLVIKH